MKTKTIYRLLEIGEKIQEGDEYYAGSGCWNMVSSSIDNNVRFGSGEFRRKMTVPDWPYEVGEEIEVSNNAEIKDGNRRTFVGITTNGVVLVEDKQSGRYGAYQFHRPITKQTEPKRIPLTAEDITKMGIDKIRRKDFAKHCWNLITEVATRGVFTSGNSELESYQSLMDEWETWDGKPLYKFAE